MKWREVNMAIALLVVSWHATRGQTKSEYPSRLETSAALDEAATALRDFQETTAHIDFTQWKATNRHDAEDTSRALAEMREVVQDVQNQISKMQNSERP